MNKWVLKEVLANLLVDFEIKTKTKIDTFENYNYLRLVLDSFSSTLQHFNSNKSFNLYKDIFNQVDNTLKGKITSEKFNLKELEFINHNE